MTAPPRPTPAPTDEPRERVRRALAALELGTIRRRRGARQALRVGEEELSALLYLAHHGGVTQRRLADATALSRSGASAMIQRLEERGLVERSTDDTDRRLRLVELSPTGRALLAEAYARFDDAAQTVLESRPQAELDALAELLLGLAESGTEAETEEPEPAAPRSSRGEPIWRRWA